MVSQPDDPKRQHIYVAQIQLANGEGWTSLHITGTDSWNKLAEWAIESGIEIDAEYSTAEQFDSSGLVQSYSVSFLPIHHLGE